ncbi:MAG: sugar ABC transporter permease [Candidatus Aureabacteria bacterium]|nr:sugar ABC transporter permease [Candidatus Auribacterota bacterium]
MDKLYDQKKLNFKSLLGNYTFILPALIMFLLFNVYPVFLILKLSFYEWDGISPLSAMKFIGVRHFIEIFTKDKLWWESVWHAGIITLLALTLQNALALILALAVDKGIRGGNIYRVIFFMPPVLSGIVIGLIWKWIYDGHDGLLNHFLVSIGITRFEHMAWLANPETALYAVAIIHMWRGFGWGFIILLAGLQNIDTQLYEAAEVDGAEAWHKFIHITCPLMIPVFILVSILTILGTMQIYDLIVSMTNGGPEYYTEVPITRILASMQGENRFGYACARGLVFGGMLLILSMLQIKISKRLQKNL